MNQDLTSDLSKNLMYQLATLHRLFRKEAVKNLQEMGDITLEMLSTLSILAQNQPINQQGLADILLLDRSATKRNVDQLLKRQLVEVNPCKDNLKNKEVILTKLGQETFIKGKQVMEITESKWLADIAQSDIDNALSLIKTIINKNS